jgi:hypothetical protein
VATQLTIGGKFQLTKPSLLWLNKPDERWAITTIHSSPEEQWQWLYGPGKHSRTKANYVVRRYDQHEYLFEVNYHVNLNDRTAEVNHEAQKEKAAAALQGYFEPLAEFFDEIRKESEKPLPYDQFLRMYKNLASSLQRKLSRAQMIRFDAFIS